MNGVKFYNRAITVYTISSWFVGNITRFGGHDSELRFSKVENQIHANCFRNDSAI